MPMWAKRSLMLLLLLGVAGALPFLEHSAFAAEAVQRIDPATGIKHTSTDALTLRADAPPPPTLFASYTRFGFYESAIVALSAPTSSAVISWQSHVPSTTAALITMRGRDADGQWIAWSNELTTGATVRFDRPVAALQYRVVLLGSTSASPTIAHITLVPAVATLRAFEESAARPLAPTYRLRVTRQGMVGGRTANGHVITRNDVFVSLPSWSSLSSKGGHEYQVRLTANGKSVIAPVWDVGPWNHHDNYWDKQRQTYSDLPTGWPEDHAAYYENYNKRRAEEGYVRYPTAVDIGDGAYWALGLNGQQTSVDVTFLWLGTDPGNHPQPRNADSAHRPTRTADEPAPAADPGTLQAEEVQVEAGSPQFDASTSAWQWATCGNQAARWLPGQPTASEAALWRPELGGGTYEVTVHIPVCAGLQPTTQTASYIVHGADGNEPTVSINQAGHPDSWVTLGQFQFAAGTSGFVKLLAAEPQANQAVWFDAVHWRRIAN